MIREDDGDLPVLASTAIWATIGTAYVALVAGGFYAIGLFLTRHLDAFAQTILAAVEWLARPFGIL